MRSHRASKSLLVHGSLLGVVAVWGGTFPLVKGAFADASPLLFNLLRMILATGALVVINRRQLRTLSRTNTRLGLIAGAFLGVGYQLQTAGLARTSSTKSAFITGLVVVVVALLTLIPSLRSAHIPIFRSMTISGAILAFAGLALLTIPSGAALAEITSEINIGDALTFLCAIAFAGHLLTLSRVAPRSSAGSLATLQVACATALMVVTLHVNGPVHLHPTFRLVLALLVTSLLATAAAFTIQSWAQQHLPATHIAALLTLEPVFALLTSVLFFHEQPTGRTYMGAALILGGILTIELGGTTVPPNPILGSPPGAPLF